MKNILRAVFGLIAVAGIAFLGFAAYVSSQPGEITISQSIEIAASPADVRPYARDLKAWNEWSPWAELDPNVKNVFSEPSDGMNAWFTWEGNDDVGKGKMTVKADEPNKVVHEIAFERPFEGMAMATISWKGKADKTTVTWSFQQEADFGTKAANLFMDIEGMLMKDYVKGLALLKPLVETAAKERVVAEKQKFAEEAMKAAQVAAEAASEAARVAGEAARAAADAAR